MGQDLLNPPTVEGWHTGAEWIDSGSLVERINFTASQVGDVSLPGIRAIVNRLSSEGTTMSAERLVDRCLDMVGGYGLPEETQRELIARVSANGMPRTATEDFANRVGQVLQWIVCTQEYQFC